MKTDILDSLIAIAIILFILSIIVEKITQAIRRYAPFIKPLHKGARGVFHPASFLKNIGSRQTGNTDHDRKVEREVAMLSFWIGLLIALLFHVDLFRMMNVGDPRDVLFWDQKKWDGLALIDLVLLTLSLALTGFFLSFGSKFFHDLLDMLLQVKNLKRKLVDEETYAVDDVQQLDEYLNKSYSDLIQLAIEQNREILQTPHAVSSPMHGKMKKDGRRVDCIDLHVSGNDRGMLPTSIQARLPSGKTLFVPVNIIFDVSIPEALVLQGDAVSDDHSPGFKGTICFRISRNGKPELLTCSHVFTGGSAANHRGDLPLPSRATIVTKHTGSFRDAAFTWAVCDEQYDVAVLSAPSLPFTYRIPPSTVRAVKPSDMYNTLVRVVGRDGGIKEGIIINDKVPEPTAIRYKNPDSIHALSNLMLISQLSTTNGESQFKAMTTAGDSGACVYDADDHPIGMIVAGNSKFSYAIPITDILTKLSATIIN